MQKDILPTIKRFYRKNRRLPSYAEMLKLFGVASKKSIFDYVQKLIDDGFLKKAGNKLAPTSRFFALPVLGMIRAGYPIIAEQDKHYLTIDEYLIENPDNSFLLKVQGDSMINAGIFEGDLVVIEQRKNAKQGDIVLAEIDKEWTLKIFKTDGKSRLPYLQAANPDYPPFKPMTELMIHGIVRAVMRKVN